MRKLGLAVSIVLIVSLGCSQAARDSFKHWFFEIPEQSEVTSEAPAAEPESSSAKAETAPHQVESKYLSVHAPYADRQCNRCHDPEQRMAVRDDLEGCCLSCHRQYFDEDTIEHSPVADRECLTCHDLHRSTQLSLLKGSVLELCAPCHDEPSELSEDAHGGEGVENCVRCHDPHFGEAPYLKPGVEGSED